MIANNNAEPIPKLYSLMTTKKAGISNYGIVWHSME